MCTPVSVSITYAGSVIAKILPYIVASVLLSIGAAFIAFARRVRAR